MQVQSKKKKKLKKSKHRTADATSGFDGADGKGSISQNSISADNFLNELLLLKIGQISTPKTTDIKLSDYFWTLVSDFTAF
jgi:hypothetical protein